MKKDIHPKYDIATVKCVCGNEFQTRSTLKEISVEICSACHPFFTGQQKLVDSAGRVERFMRKYGTEYGGGEIAGGKAPAEASAKDEASSKSEPDADAAAGEDKPAADAAAEKGESKPDAEKAPEGDAKSDQEAEPSEKQDKTSE